MIPCAYIFQEGSGIYSKKHIADLFSVHVVVIFFVLGKNVHVKTRGKIIH